MSVISRYEENFAEIPQGLKDFVYFSSVCVFHVNPVVRFHVVFNTMHSFDYNIVPKELFKR